MLLFATCDKLECTSLTDAWVSIITESRFPIKLIGQDNPLPIRVKIFSYKLTQRIQGNGNLIFRIASLPASRSREPH